MVKLVSCFRYRSGDATKSCQDAVSWNPEHCRLAVADGATNDVCHQDLFAQMLVDEFTSAETAASRLLFSPGVEAPSQADDDARLKDWRQVLAPTWRECVKPFLMPEDDWAEGRRETAATFAGVELCHTSDGRFEVRGMIVGDSFVFLLRDELPLEVLTRARDGKRNNPQVVHVRSTDTMVDFSAAGMLIPRVLEGRAHVAVCTDALGYYLRKEFHQRESELIETLRRLRTQSAFNRWIAGLRSEGRLDDDDVALVAVEVSADAEEVKVTLHERAPHSCPPDPPITAPATEKPGGAAEPGSASGLQRLDALSHQGALAVQWLPKVAELQPGVVVQSLTIGADGRLDITWAPVDSRCHAKLIRENAAGRLNQEVIRSQALEARLARDVEALQESKAALEQLGRTAEADGRELQEVRRKLRATEHVFESEKRKPQQPAPVQDAANLRPTQQRGNWLRRQVSRISSFFGSGA